MAHKGNYIGQLLAIAGFVLALSGCSSTSDFGAYSVRLRQDSYVTAKGGKPEWKKAGAVLFYQPPEMPLFIHRPGHLGVFLVPSGSRPEQVEVALPEFDPWSTEWAQRYSDQSLQDVLRQTSTIQSLLAKGQASVALDKLESLQQRYPRILALRFLKVSTLMLLGEKERAKTLLGEALRAWPDNPEGRALYQSLTGHPYVSEFPATPAPTNEEQP